MPEPGEAIPTVAMQPVRRARWVWLIPLAALVFVAILVAQSVMRRGPLVIVSMNEGHGLAVGAPVQCRGIIVGEVERIGLRPGLDAVEAHVRLEPGAADIARGGSRFWVVRARFDLTGVGGLDTIVRPNYLAVIPGSGAPQLRFDALENPPIITDSQAGGLEIVLLAAQRGSISAGAPVLYRQVPIGRVTSVGLSTDAASVAVRVHIEARYASLVRDNSHFWNVSGTSWSFGMTGVRWQAQSLASVLDGGIAMATPDEPGQPVMTGHTFTLEAEAKDAYLTWRPSLPVGAALLPVDTALPPMQRVTLTVPGKRIWNRTHRLAGWVLPTKSGLLGPRDLFADGDGATLEIVGRSIALANHQLAEGGEAGGQLGILDAAKLDIDLWQADTARTLTEAEDCVIFTDVADPLLPVDAMRLIADEDRPHVWRIDGSVPIGSDLHGAAVLSRVDGTLVGLLVIGSDGASVHPVTIDK